MPDPVKLSCPLCLRAAPQDLMVAVHIDHGMVTRDFDLYICRQCANAIVRAYSGELGAAAPDPAGGAAVPAGPTHQVPESMAQDDED